MSERLSSASRNSERLAIRRRRNRRRIFVVVSILFLAVGAGIVYGLSQKYIRISHISIYDGDQSLVTVAEKAMAGKYFGLIPRDSTLFFPASSIRNDILRTYPDVAAVSIFRSGFTDLSIKVDYRIPVARWCGVGLDPMSVNFTATSSKSNLTVPTATCYFFDANGFVYATTTSVAPVNSFLIYAPLASSSPVGGIIGTTLLNADKLPFAFDFARELATFGSSIDLIIFRGDEVDDYFSHGTRVTYVLGNEKNAFAAFSSASGNFNLTDGSIDYIDLRFPGKVYVKKK